MNREDIFNLSLDIGKNIISCGGEINRAKDTIIRINRTYNMECEVFALPSVIIAQNGNMIQIRRIDNTNDDLELLSRLNSASRLICNEKIIKQCPQARKEYNFVIEALAVFTATSAFCIYFGGKFNEAIISGLIGLIINNLKLSKYSLPAFTDNIICAFTASVITAMAKTAIPSLDSDKIIIGTIMLLVPGLTTVSAIRDMMNGDLIAGIFELFNAIMSALAIAFGVAGGIWVMSWL